MFRIALAAALITAVPASAATDQLARVQAHLRAITTMTANFTQTDQSDKVLTGTLMLKQPGKIRFQYQKGVPLLIVGDGHALTMIDYQVGQVSRWPIGHSPLSLLLDPSRDISAYAHAVPAGADRVTIEGRDPKHPELGTIDIAFAPDAGAPGGLKLLGWSVLDAQGNRSIVQLSNQHFNAAIDDKTFLWRDPRPNTRGR